jgi:hypothetical protein
MARKIKKTALATWSDAEIEGLPAPWFGRRDNGYRLVKGSGGVSVRVRVSDDDRLVCVAVSGGGKRRWQEVGPWKAAGDASVLRAKAIALHTEAQPNERTKDGRACDSRHGNRRPTMLLTRF